jgi:hypothetical protein
MQPFRCAMPGALRLRTLQPLIDADGGCSLVYDVERAALFEVPEDLRLHVAPALETGNLDEELLGWLASEDLLTAESCGEWGGCDPGIADPEALDPRASAPDFSALDMAAAAAGSAGSRQRRVRAAPGHGCDEVHGWIDQPSAVQAIEALDMVFRRGCGSSRIKLHLDWVGTLPSGGLLDTVIVEARRRAEISGQEVSFELVIAPDQVTPEAASRLAEHPLHVRLRCGECDPLAWLGTDHENRPWLLGEPAVKLLLEHRAQRRPLAESSSPLQRPLVPFLTVQCVLHGASRLIELWRWAGAAGVRSLDAIRLEETGTREAEGPSACATPAARAREYRQDLYAIYEETCAELEAGRLPIDFQPLTRIVRRLMRSEASAAGAGARDAMLMRHDGGPFGGVETLDPRLLPELIWLRLEDSAGPGRAALAQSAETVEAEAAGLLCQGCWARQLCSHSAYVASPLGKEDPRDPSRERCALWSAEVEMAARLYHRLPQIDALQVVRFFEGEPALPTFAWRRGYADPETCKPS